MIDRFIDEKEAWIKLGVAEDQILKSLGKACVFCEVQTFSNSYVLHSTKGEPLLTAVIYRDALNYTILFMTTHNDEIKRLTELNNRGNQ